jgi:hypothetical protein
LPSEGIHLAGENYGILEKFFEAESDINRTMPTHTFRAGPLTHAKFDIADIHSEIQQMFITINDKAIPVDDIIGFKEIRHHTPKAIEYIKQIFPCSRLIFNYRRNVTDQLEAYSRIGSFRRRFNGSTEKMMEEIQRNIRINLSLYPQTTTSIILEDFSPNNFTKLVQWLGYDDCVFTSIAHSNDRTKGVQGTKTEFYSSDKKSVKIEGKCNRHF